MTDRRLKIGLVLQEGIDHPYNQGPYLGIERAVRDLDVKGRVLTPAPKEGHAPSLSYLARQKYDLVVANGVRVADALDAVALKFPDQTFAIIDVDHMPCRTGLGTFRASRSARRRPDSSLGGSLSSRSITGRAIA